MLLQLRCLKFVPNYIRIHEASKNYRNVHQPGGLKLKNYLVTDYNHIKKQKNMEHKLYLYDNEKEIIMDLKARKYNFIQELFKVDKENVMTALERVLKQETEEHQEISKANKKELDSRLKSYKDNPDDVLDWEEVKRDW